MRYCTAFFLLMALAPPAQSQAVRPLGAATGSASEPFSAIAGIVELRGGRVLVADSRETALRLVDVSSGAVTQVSREGAGPTEYRSAGGLFRWRGDSVAMYDPSARRVLILTGAGTPVRSFQLSQYLAFAAEQPGRSDVRFIDRLGRIYTQSAAIPVVEQGKAAPDSGPVLRYDPRRPGVDTVAIVKLNGLVQRPDAGGSSINIGAVANPFRVQDTWVAFADGRVAVLRSGNYYVEWIASAGTRIRGPATPYTRVRVTAADRAIIQRTGVSIGSGGAIPIPPEMLTDLPEMKPAFDHRTAVADPAGAVWVQRFASATDSAVVYDVIDARGILTSRVRLPFSSRVVAVSAQHVYVARTDEDGLRWLTRHRR